ncbi:C3HC zinc finger-like-domain-containing protein [Thamnidium elegans]|nr:C3HC zinc finger-like-domain-containing protein [Thamnidium elegans]
MTESDSIQLSTDTDDVRKEAEELKDLIQQVRSRIDLPPIFKAKKRCFEQLDGIYDSSLPSKKILLEDNNVELSKIDSREDLMTRLSSYSTNFHLTQRPVTALGCAKHGWKDTDKTTEKEPDTCVLCCNTCGNNIFVIAIKHKASEKVINEVKKRYEAGLYNGHKELCQWRTQKCDDGVYCFPLVTIESGLEKFKGDANNIISACVKKQQALPTLCHELVSKKYMCNVFLS